MIALSALPEEHLKRILEHSEVMDVGFTDFNIYHFTLGISPKLNNTFIGVGFEYSTAKRSDFKQIFNFPSGVIETGDLVIPRNIGTSEPFYNNFNLFFGVTQLR